jgi:methylamine--corrinoid protein Co-methyltransferase
MNTVSKNVTVYDVYDRAKRGPKMEEKEWDFKVIPKTARALKKKYNIKMDKSKMIPDDPELIDNLFKAGLEMLETCGIYCIDTGRVIKYTRDEILHALDAAPDHFTFGTGKEAHTITPRAYNAKEAPIIQGGPTGSPCSEEMFLPIHQAYAQEPIVDTIVDGVMQTVMEHDPQPGTPWELIAVRSEALQVREAMVRAGRAGMGL